jgi:hypothetical protein
LFNDSKQVIWRANGHNTLFQRSINERMVVIAFHGDACEFLRNKFFDARNYFNFIGTTQPFHRNQFGGTLGGPIQKDKTFFFVNYEGLRLRQRYIAPSTVPTAHHHPHPVPTTFRSLLSLATPIHVKNPYYWQGLYHSQRHHNRRFRRQRQLDSGRNLRLLGTSLASFDPTATLVTATGVAPGNSYNFFASGTEQRNEFAIKVDHTFSAQDKCGDCSVVKATFRSSLCFQ